MQIAAAELYFYRKFNIILMFIVAILASFNSYPAEYANL